MLSMISTSASSIKVGSRRIGKPGCPRSPLKTSRISPALAFGNIQHHNGAAEHVAVESERDSPEQDRLVPFIGNGVEVA